MQIKGPPTLIRGACGEIKLKLQITCHGTFYEMSWRWSNEMFYESLEMELWQRDGIFEWRWRLLWIMSSRQYSLCTCHVRKSIDYGPGVTWQPRRSFTYTQLFPSCGALVLRKWISCCNLTQPVNHGWAHICRMMRTGLGHTLVLKIGAYACSPRKLKDIKNR